MRISHRQLRESCSGAPPLAQPVRLGPSEQTNATTNAKQYAVLVLTRKTQQQIQIGDKITITILRVKGNAVRVGIDAPRDERIIRSELDDKPQPATRGAVVTGTINPKAGSARPDSIADEIALDDHDSTAEEAEETVRPLANRVRALTAQTVRYPERLGISSLRCALGRR